MSRVIKLLFVVISYVFVLLFYVHSYITFLNDEYKPACNDNENYEEINTYLGGVIL